MKNPIVSMILLVCGIGACEIYPEVEYELTDTGIRCIGHDDKFVFETEGYKSVTCTWYCHNYKGHTGAYVSLDFVSMEGNFYLDSEFIDNDGICE